ncbi:hypothetical protein J6590_040649 [Homalodisca vitripennis]|nr:hypothetical protein J6590_040649 [Homalodisca vitripennis]
MLQPVDNTEREQALPDGGKKSVPVTKYEYCVFVAVREVPKLWAEQSQGVRSRTTVVPGLRHWNLTSTWSCLDTTSATIDISTLLCSLIVSKEVLSCDYSNCRSKIDGQVNNLLSSGYDIQCNDILVSNFNKASDSLGLIIRLNVHRIRTVTAKTDVALKSGQPLWMSRSCTSLTAYVEILGCKVLASLNIGVPPPARHTGPLQIMAADHLLPCLDDTSVEAAADEATSTESTRVRALERAYVFKRFM